MENSSPNNSKCTVGTPQPALAATAESAHQAEPGAEAGIERKQAEAARQVWRAEDVIAPAHLQELRQMSDLIPEMLETFRNDFLPRLEIMREAIATPAPERLAEAAHGVKGAAGSLGGVTLARLCSELEQKGRTGDLHGAEAFLPRIEVEFERLCRALTIEIGAQP